MQIDNYFYWNYYLITAKNKVTNEIIIFVDIIRDINNVQAKHNKSNSFLVSSNIIIENIYDLPLNIKCNDKGEAEIFATLFACILKFNYPQFKIYSTHYYNLNNDITSNIILENMKIIFEKKITDKFYDNYNIFFENVIKNKIKLGEINLNLIIPTEKDGNDIIMWN